jgi:glycosyltransferase involved in cell wall biosynthesis
MNVALAHEYFAVRGGAERVVEALHRMWPAAPVYTFFHDVRAYGALEGWRLRRSFLQSFPHVGGLHRVLLPLYPRAARALRVDPAVDVLLSSTSAFIKGVTVADRTVHVAYCHSPTRYLWDWSERYVEEEVPAPLRGVVRDLLVGLREADRQFARRVDRWLANSRAVAERIRTYYAAPSEVVHPPVDLSAFAPAERGDFWLFAPGRLVAYKRGDVAVRAFNEVGMRLIVVGDGRERGALERIAKENVTFTGRVSDATLRELLGAARGLVFPGEDDFGIVCVEALASGAPVVALARGGAPEIVRDGVDGALVQEPDPAAFAEAVRRVERDGPDRAALRESARRFEVGRFEARVREVVAEAAEKGRATSGSAARSESASLEPQRGDAATPRRRAD